MISAASLPDKNMSDCLMSTTLCLPKREVSDKSFSNYGFYLYIPTYLKSYVWCLNNVLNNNYLFKKKKKMLKKIKKFTFTIGK